MSYFYTYNTVLGKFTLVEDGNALTEVHFGRILCPYAQELQTSLMDKTADQIEEYSQGNRREFNLPLNPAGTQFQKMVWDALCTIPYGEVRSYQDIAVQIGNSKACRAVGMANNRNPIPILVPCHRVVGADGSLTGYGGGIDLKRRLLALEGVMDLKESLKMVSHRQV